MIARPEARKTSICHLEHTTQIRPLSPIIRQNIYVARTQGHGNPDWTEDETILALNLYFDCGGSIPSTKSDEVRALSELLQRVPVELTGPRNARFRNPDGIGFKLQNLRQVATGQGLANVSQMDRKVWSDLGHDPGEVKRLASLIRSSLLIFDRIKTIPDEETFPEGRVVTAAHLRIERDPRARESLLMSRRSQGGLQCDLCDLTVPHLAERLADAVFEVHHLLPLSSKVERRTRVDDLALLCANCHRLLHRAIVVEGRWLTPQEARGHFFHARRTNNEYG